MTRKLATRQQQVVSDKAVLDLETHVPYFFTFISNRLSRGASHTYRKYYKLGISEWRVMAVIALAPNINANQACALVGMDKAAVSRSLQVLEKRKLVSFTQVENDNRSRNISLTAAGQKMHDEIVQIAHERERRLMSCLTSEEAAAFRKSLRKLQIQVDELNKWDPGPPSKNS